MSLGSTEVALWLDQRQYDALRRILQGAGTDVETVMQARLEDLYRQTVPDHVRREIDLEIEAERLAQERQRENSMRVSAFHITEKGQDRFFVTHRPVEFLEIAKLLRQYLRCGADDAEWFSVLFPGRRRLEEEQFRDFAKKRIEDPQKIVGVFNIDLDCGTVSSLDHLQGWQSYKIGDISAAAYYAFRKEWQTEEQRRGVFLERLDGKEIGQKADTAPRMQML